MFLKFSNRNEEESRFYTILQTIKTGFSLFCCFENWKRVRYYNITQQGIRSFFASRPNPFSSNSPFLFSAFVFAEEKRSSDPKREDPEKTQWPVQVAVKNNFVQDKGNELREDAEKKSVDVCALLCIA